MLLELQAIKIKKRVRKDLGDIIPLMESLRDHGLLNPVVINHRHELVAGRRRLEAARKLGWERIETTVLDTADELAMLELEIEENVLRRDFSPAELDEALIKLAKLRNPGFFRRLWGRIRKLLRLRC